MIKKSSLLLAILLIVCITMGVVSASESGDSNSDSILNSDEITSDDLNTLSAVSVDSDNLNDDQSDSKDDSSSSDEISSSSISDSNIDSESPSKTTASANDVDSSYYNGDSNSNSANNDNNIGDSDILSSLSIVSSPVMNTDDDEPDISNVGAYSAVMKNDGTSEESILSSTGASNSGSKTISLANVLTGAINLEKYVLKNKTLPSTVTVGGVTYTISQFSYLMSVAIQNINAKKLSTISVIDVTKPSFSAQTINTNISLADYLKVASSVSSAGKNKKVLPAYVSLSSKKADFRVYTYAFAKILAFYKSNKRLPNVCLFESKVFKNSPTPSNNSFTISQIASASSTLKSYVLKNKKLPSTVTVGKSNVTIAQFSYLMSTAIKNLKNNKTSKISLINTTNKNSTKNSIYTNISLADYVKVASSVSSAGKNKKVLPAYVALSSKKADFRVYTYAFAKVLDFYKSKKRLPNVCLFDSTVFSDSPTPSNNSFTISQIASASSNVRSYIDKNKKLPSTVTVGKSKVTIAQFTYLMTAAIQNINAKKSSKISLINVTKDNYNGASISTTIDKDAYMKIVNNIVKTSKSNKKVPKYVTVGSKKADFKTYTYAFAKVLDFYGSKKRLPNTLLVTSSPYENSTYKKGINEINTISDLSDYLKASGNCALNNQIIALAKKLTSGNKTALQKATAIFNYVRDNISYTFYANSKKKASGTLTSKSGNCCDKANLVVALCRASGIAARYSHGKGCHFRSGLTTGHVWAQILVGNTWYAADTTSHSNSLGKIVNWDTSSFTLRQYASLPF